MGKRNFIQKMNKLQRIPLSKTEKYRGIYGSTITSNQGTDSSSKANYFFYYTKNNIIPRNDPIDGK